jgi:hypothetical protein
LTLFTTLPSSAQHVPALGSRSKTPSAAHETTNFVLSFTYARTGVFFDEGFRGDARASAASWAPARGVAARLLDIDIGDSLGAVVASTTRERWRTKAARERKRVVDDTRTRTADGARTRAIDMHAWLCRDIDAEARFIRFRVG